MESNWRWCTQQSHLPSRSDGLVLVWSDDEPPHLDDVGDWAQTRYRAVPLCVDDFERLFGFLPPHERPIKVRFSAEVLPDDVR